MQPNKKTNEQFSSIAEGYRYMNNINSKISEDGFEADIMGLFNYEAGLALESDVEI
ncbi:MAG TPA: hypothetical protein VJ990_07690 [Clostridia bacterium]|nr:hypothetical protein [Clostridia bacterium]